MIIVVLAAIALGYAWASRAARRAKRARSIEAVLLPLPLPRKPASVPTVPFATSTARESEPMKWTVLDDRQLYRLLDESGS